MADMASRSESNRVLVEEAFEGWRDGTYAITDLFAPGMVWRIEGHSLAAGEYDSSQQFIDEVLTPFGARFSHGERFRPVTIRSITADSDTVVVVWDGEGIANDRQQYRNSYAWIMRFANNKVIDGTAFFDSISFDQLWNRVQP